MIPTSSQFWGAAYGSSNGTPAGAIDHGGLAGLGDDDHPQYLLLAGRALGQIAYGGTGAGEDLTLRSTANATKGSIILDQCLDVTLNPAGTFETQINSVVLLTINTVGATLQKAAAPFVFYYDNYSATATDTNYIYFRKSHNNTLGTLTRTVDTEVLARFDFWGVEAGGARREGAIIRALQNGATNTQVPTNLIFETYTDAALNTNQFIIHSDNSVRVRGSAGLYIYEGTGAEYGYIQRTLGSYLRINSGTGANLELMTPGGLIVFNIAAGLRMYMESAKLYPVNTSAFDLGDTTHIFQDTYTESVKLYDTAGTNGILVSGSAMASYLTFKANAGTFSGILIDYAATNADQEIRVYSTTAAHDGGWLFLRSHHNSLGNNSRTLDGDYLGTLQGFGILAGGGASRGWIIRGIQNGATNTAVPCNLTLETSSDTALWTNQLMLHSDGSVRIRSTNGLYIYDNTGAEYGSISRDLNFLVIDGGTGGEIRLADWTTMYAALGFHLFDAGSANPIDINNRSGYLFIGYGTGGTVFHGLNLVSQSETQINTLDVGSATVTHCPTILMRKSHAVANTRTVDSDVLGGLLFAGFDATPAQALGASITAQQEGATSTYVPANMFLETYSATAKNTFQLVLHNDGYIGMGLDAPLARLHIDGTTTEGHELVYLQQDDDNEPFIRYEGTTAADNTKNISTDNNEWTGDGYILISVNGADKWIRYYDYPV